MFNLAKTFSLFGITGLGIASPIVYEGATAPHYETLWKKRLNSEVLIGKCSTGEDDGLEDKYKIYLSVEGEERFNKGLGIKMLVVIFSDVIWNGIEAREEIVYDDWSLRADSQKGMEFVLKQGGSEEAEIKWDGGGSCWINNIQKTDGIYSQDRNIVKIEAKDIKLECSESSIRKGFGWATCDVVFSKENNLKWKDGFRPKLTFSAF